MSLRRAAAAVLASLAVADRASAETVASTLMGVVEPSFWAGLIGWIQAQQRMFHAELVAAFQALVDSGGTMAAALLIGASFLYGVFHAAGPGHGKMVLTTYLATHGERLPRGIGLAVAGSLCQGIVAIALIYGLLGLAEWAAPDSRSAVKISEQVSAVLLMLLGGGLAAKALVDATAHLRASGASGGAGADCRGCGVRGLAAASAPAGLSARIGLVASIGLRPCTGAIIVLVFAQAVGLFWAGIAAVAAMSAGTALAVAPLALVVVNARALAARFIGGEGRRWRLIGYGIALAGGAALAAIGFSLLMASLAPAHPLGF